MVSTGRPTGRIAALDGLRGLACLLVFGVHFGQITHLDGSVGPFELGRLLANGHVGVALFFALSGMLLSIPFWRAARDDTPTPALGRYFASRCIRILPAYYICLTALIVDNRSWEDAHGWSDVGLHYALVFNYADWSIFSINPPFWTIAVEAQFYVLLPLFFVLSRRMNMTATAVLIVSLALASYAAHVWMVGVWLGGTDSLSVGPGVLSPVLEYSLLAHLPHFLLGVLAGGSFLYLSQFDTPRTGIADMVSWVSLVGIALVLSTPIDDWLRIPYGRYNLPYVPLLIVMLITTAPFSRLMRKVLDGFPLRHLGLISYGVYLYHFPVLHVTARYLARISIDVQKEWWLLGAISLGLTIAVATASYLIVERPLIRAFRLFTKTRGDAPIMTRVTAPEFPGATP